MAENFFLNLGDRFFLLFHSAFTLFNLTGWIFKGTRKIHRLTMTATLLSWTVIGYWYGWGYCFCTDWHWRIREALGRPIESRSYIHFLIGEIFNVNVNEVLVDKAVAAVFIFLVCVTVIFGARDFRRGKS